MVARVSLLVLLLLLMMNQGAAQAPDVSFSLTLPTRPDGARAIATLEAVVIAMGAHLTYAKGDATGLLDAAWDPATAITGHLRYKDVGPPPARELSIACIKVSGGAEALCREVERRYLTQYR
jgi:hypothetical protein